MPIISRKISTETPAPPKNPAELAVEARQRAQTARTQAEQIRTDAETRAAALLAEASQQAQQLLGDAQRADAEALHLDLVHRRTVEIERLRGEISDGEQKHQQLDEQADTLEEQLDDLEQRQAELTRRRDDVGQRRQVARNALDADALSAALTEQTTVNELLVEVAGRIEQAEAQHAVICGDDGALALLDQHLDQLRGRLDELEREQAGLPPRAEIAELVAALLPMVASTLPVGDVVAPFRQALEALPAERAAEFAGLGPQAVAAAVGATFGAVKAEQLTAGLERLAVEDPDAYASQRAALLRRPAPTRLPARVDPPEPFVVTETGALRYTSPPQQVR
jgi:chromosome segregation ATPase